MKYELHITLRSDLCAGNGKAVGAVIDSDVCLDCYGVPYIPARRLKGVLREEAQKLVEYKLLDSENVKNIFGETGKEGGSIKIKNATICGDSLGKSLSKKYSAVQIADAFTTVKAQTALDENGCADSETLRFTRVVNQYIDENPLKFISEIDVDSANEGKIVEMAAKALRHMGMNRTRGLGVVDCTLLGPCSSGRKATVVGNCTEGRRAEIRYFVRLDAPITLVRNGGGIFHHVAASSVIGLFAGQYLKKGVPDEMFSKLFLESKTQWSALYPVYCRGEFEVEKAIIAQPAPLYIQSTKYDANNERNKSYVNVYAAKRDTSDDYAKRQPSMLSNSYVVETNGDYVILKPEVENHYHHSDKGDGSLYVQNSIAAGQVYGGKVVCDYADIDTVVTIIENANIAFGRSKSAQYASCSLLAVEKSDVEDGQVEILKGKDFYVVLESDYCPIKCADITPTSVQSVITEYLGVGGKAKPCEALCAYMTVSGFNAKWKLQKPTHRVVAAGSAYSFNATENITVMRHGIIGCNIKEGFGAFRIVTEDEMKAKVIEGDVYRHGGEEFECERYVNYISKVIEHKTKMAEISLRAHEFFDKNRDALGKLNASFIGRVVLMLKESVDKKDFLARIESIKDTNKKELIKVLNKSLIGKLSDDCEWQYVRLAQLEVLALTKYMLRANKKIEQPTK